MKYLTWLKNNLNFVSLIIGITLVATGDADRGYELIKGGLN